METAPFKTSSYTCSTRDSGIFQVSFRGDWRGAAAFTERAPLFAEIDRATGIRVISLEGSQLEGWDSSFLVLLRALSAHLALRKLTLEYSALPVGVSRLLTLAEAVPQHRENSRKRNDNFIVRMGLGALRVRKEVADMVSFLGEIVIALYQVVRGKSRLRKRELFVLIDECGPQALPIVTLISVLVGLILAFIGAVQLQQFGAQIYVANLVGVAMAREMGAVMAGIILAGRTGAAFAAQLGTMEVNEEIDALRTLGIPVIDFLVVPRVLALALMMPLLCLYADLLGILGGTVIGLGAMGISPALYLSQTVESVALSDFGFGVVKSAVFGILIALSGCMRGMQSGRSASAVGEAATSAVVTAIVLIVVTDALFAVASNILGI